MSAIILFMAGMAAIAGWGLSQQTLTAKPWLEEGVAVDFREASTSSLPPAKIGLGVFLAGVGSLFALFLSAHSLRMRTVGAPGRHGRCNHRAVRRGSVCRHIPGRAAPGVATAARRGVFSRLQSSQFLLLPDHRGARTASDGRPGGPWQNDRQGVAWRRDDAGASERGALRYLLAFPAVGLAGLARSADGLDRRFRRHLSPAAQLGRAETQWQRLR